MDDKTKKLKELFENFDSVSAESMQEIVGESIKSFEKIISKLNSPNEEERKKALEDAAELRDILEEQAKKALEKSGLDKKAVDKFINNPDNFTPEEWRALQEAKKEIDTYHHELEDKGVIKEEKAKSKEHKKTKKPKKPKNWLHG